MPVNVDTPQSGIAKIELINSLRALSKDFRGLKKRMFLVSRANYLLMHTLALIIRKWKSDN